MIPSVVESIEKYSESYDSGVIPNIEYEIMWSICSKAKVFIDIYIGRLSRIKSESESF